ncbi:glycosyltransferase [Candidatus Sumerlaeota bacterium]|nr:glycosyltransferase [Candidatus Sumerlaeota bacterium]
MIFLIQSPHAWRGARQRPHHLAARFAGAGHAVRWVEPRYLRWLIDDRARFFQSRRERLANGIEVVPVTLINGERFSVIRNFNKSKLRGALSAPPPNGAGKRVLWLYNPHESHLARTVPHDLLVYDMMDEYRGFPWSPPGIAEEERYLLECADWVFAGTQALYDAKKEMAAGKIECVLSGVEADHFREPGDPGGNHAERIATLKTRFEKLVGYAGVIDQRIDQSLLAESASRHPDWGYLLIGPRMVNTASLDKIASIIFTGQIDYSVLPAYYHSWDCAIIPFVENELTRHLNPTKILEYAASSKPILTRALPDIEKYYADGAFLYRSPPEFEEHLIRILTGDPEAAAGKLRASQAWLNDRSWDAIAPAMLNRVDSLPSRRPLAQR